MIDFAEVERLNFRDAASLERLDALLGEVASYAETRSAAEIAQILQKKAADRSLASTLNPFIAKFRMLALPLLTDDQALEQVRNIGPVIGDERIGTYERFRARLLVLPPSRRTGFSQQLLARLRQSPEPFAGATVGSWVSRVDQAGGSKNAEALFAQPDFKQLDDAADHSVRHLVHLVQLLSAPEEIEARPAPPPAPVPRPASRPAPVPTAPSNLPVAPAPVMPRPAPVPPAPTAALVQPAPTPDRGPSMAAVLARLHQSDRGLSAEPPSVAHLTPEDHQEIKQHEQKLEQYDVGPNVHDTLTDEIERMIKGFGLTFGDDHLRQRFVTIITARLKDIRNANDTLELLTRPVKVGGMGLDPEQAQQIVQQASTIAASFHDEDQVRQMADRQQQVMAAPLPKPPKVPVVPQAEVPLPSSTPAAAPFAQPIPVPPRPAPVPPPPRPTVTAAAPPMPTAALRSAIADRPTVSDIRGTSRLVGPTEELRSMSLTDYRRLGPDAVSCVRRVYEKIQRLGKESFTKKAEGIRAWRESVVHQLYVAIGQESLLSGKSIREVIAAYQQSGQPTLTEEEFTYVADLNKKLRF